VAHLNPQEVVETLKLQKVRLSRGQIAACCPLHNDRHPSFTMNAETGQWICFGCGECGNLTTLLRRLQRADLLPQAWTNRPEYQRVTTRTPGSIPALLEHMRWADWMLTQGYRREDVLRDLQSQFEISRTTAYEIIGWLTGKRRVWTDERGVHQGRRYAFCLRHLREQSKEHRLAVKTEKGQWSERTARFRSYLVCVPEVKFGRIGRRKGPLTAFEMAEEAMAYLLIPRPPPEIGRWTPSEVTILTAEVIERKARGLSLVAPWEMGNSQEWETGDFSKDEADGSGDFMEFSTALPPAIALMLAA
jgi:CHC2 zinc finger